MVLKLQFEQITKFTAASLIDARLIFFTALECLRFGSCGIVLNPFSPEQLAQNLIILPEEGGN